MISEQTGILFVATKEEFNIFEPMIFPYSLDCFK